MHLQVYLRVENFKKKAHLDNLGMTASVLCAIHCAVVPVIITSLPLLGLGFLANPWFEWGMILFALCIGVSAIGITYFRKKHSLLPMILLIIGFMIIIWGHLFISSWREAVIVPVGGLLIAAAHFFNYKYAKVCPGEHPAFHLGHGHAKDHNTH